MYTETSNLNQFSPELLSLMIECIDDKIKEVNSLIDRRESMIDNSEDISEGLEATLRFQIGNKNKKLDDLYGLRVAFMNAHQLVNIREKVNQN